MSEAELVQLLGTPDSVETGDNETKIMQWRKDAAKAIKVYVHDGVVISFDRQ